MAICKFNQKGYCKFGEKCFNEHENEICSNRSECTDPDCRKRHPKTCRYLKQFGHCKLGDTCAYSHLEERSGKVEQLEVEVSELKDEVKSIKEMKEVSESKEETVKVKGLEKKVLELKDEVNTLKRMMEKKVCDLKGELSTLKEMFAKMYKLIQNRKREPNVKRKENGNEKEEVPEKADESSYKCKEAQEKFKCDKCDYETNKKVTLKKHINTKHGTD